MENFLFILAIVGGIIYKVYENYKEEMAQARKRREKMRPPTAQPTAPADYTTTSSEQPPQPYTQPEVILDAPIQQPYVDDPVENDDTPSPRRVRKGVKEIRSKLDGMRVKPTNRGTHEAKVYQAQQQRKRWEQEQLAKSDVPRSNRLEVIDLDDINFDLRSAVIQAAIMERPYKD